jgi:hypothetical protein
MKSETIDNLRALEYEVIRNMSKTMHYILDNGDTPNKRIDAIIGLNDAMKSIMRTLDRVSTRITDAP